MNNNKPKTILITTRNYSIAEGWEDIILSNPTKPDGSKLDLTNPYFLDFNDIDIIEIFIDNPTIKNKIVDGYKICVAPCLATNTTDDVKYTYLNALVQSAKDDDNDWYENFFLVSHDKDFNKSSGGYVLETEHIQMLTKDCSCLEKLIAKHRVYLFQHDIGDSIGWFIQAENLENPRGITGSACDELWKTISSSSSLNQEGMLTFFSNCDNDEQNCYPDVNEESSSK